MSGYISRGSFFRCSSGTLSGWFFLCFFSMRPCGLCVGAILLFRTCFLEPFDCWKPLFLGSGTACVLSVALLLSSFDFFPQKPDRWRRSYLFFFHFWQSLSFLYRVFQGRCGGTWRGAGIFFSFPQVGPVFFFMRITRGDQGPSSDQVSLTLGRDCLRVISGSLERL